MHTSSSLSTFYLTVLASIDYFCLLILTYIFLHFQIIPPPPPICPDSLDDADALGSMLISWYMSGYHTGYYMVSDHSAFFPNTLWFYDFVVFVTKKWFVTLGRS